MPISQDIRDLICEQLADGKSLREICRQDGMPGRSQVFRELAAESEQAFRDQYARARESGLEAMADEILDIADDGTNDFMERRNDEDSVVGYATCGEAIQRSKLRVDARRWLLSKLAPKKYGEKLELGGELRQVHRIERTIVDPGSEA
jgi:terminase small subunit-like protein